MCIPFDCAVVYKLDVQHYLSKLGMQCNKYDDGINHNISYYLTVHSGYWFSNGFQFYTVPCPTGHCNTSFPISDYYPSKDHRYPDSNVQCILHWTGVACGDCNSTANYSIQYDTTDCIPKHQCFENTDSVVPNLLLLLSVSFLYWCLVIPFIFVLLHFQFDVTAGYAYGLIFYYSVLELVINMLIKVQYIDSDTVDISLLTLPFLSNLGYLRVPFLSYLNVCLHGTETIDHVFISYIHPLIVSCLVGLIFITAKRFVVVARYIGRYVNSRSICIFLLLSYSSVC